MIRLLITLLIALQFQSSFASAEAVQMQKTVGNNCALIAKKLLIMGGIERQSKSRTEAINHYWRLVEHTGLEKHYVMIAVHATYDATSPTKDATLEQKELASKTARLQCEIEFLSSL